MPRSRMAGSAALCRRKWGHPRGVPGSQVRLSMMATTSFDPNPCRRDGGPSARGAPQVKERLLLECRVDSANHLLETIQAVSAEG